MSTIKKIFLVDDDEMLTMALSDYLTRENPHQIHTFSTGEEAMKHVGEQPDVVILDFHLDSEERNAKTGLEILNEIKKYLPNAQYIMLSSQEKYSVASKTIQSGAEKYVIKGQEAFKEIANYIDA